MDATHVIDGRPVVERHDSAGRAYYVDVETRIRVKSAGLEVTPITADVLLAAPDVELPRVDPPSTVSFDAYAVAVSAFLAPHGYHERAGYCAHRDGDSSVILSLPAMDGGHERWRLAFPERVVVDLVAAE